MIPFCRPYLSEKEIEKVTETIKNGWVTTGKVTEELERKVEEFTGAKHCVMVTSCTAALHLCLEYLKYKLNKEKLNVLVPALTFAATATEVINSGGKVIFGDVDFETMNLVPKDANYDVAIPVHLCGVKAFTSYECPVIEDSAHLMYRGQMINNNNFVCYSFYATKNLSMGEGGAICTNDSEAAAWFKQARHHGISKDGWKRYQTLNKWEYDIEFFGWKYNPSDVLSSILSVQLDRYDEIHTERQRCVDLYNDLLGYNRTGLHLYTILVSDRKKFMEIMAENDIQCSVHFLPLHKMTAFKTINEKIYPKPNKVRELDLTNTNYLGDRLVSLPLFPGLTNEEITKICKIIKETNLLMPLSA